jgi:hypothetical protein
MLHKIGATEDTSIMSTVRNNAGYVLPLSLIMSALVLTCVWFGFKIAAMSDKVTGLNEASSEGDNLLQAVPHLFASQSFCSRTLMNFSLPNAPVPPTGMNINFNIPPEFLSRIEIEKTSSKWELTQPHLVSITDDTEDTQLKILTIETDLIKINANKTTFKPRPFTFKIFARFNPNRSLRLCFGFNSPEGICRRMGGTFQEDTRKCLPQKALANVHCGPNAVMMGFDSETVTPICSNDAFNRLGDYGMSAL